MGMKLLGLIAGVAIGGFSSVGAANADTITVFNVAGSFGADEFLITPLPPPVPLSGTLTIDVTTGSITASNLVIPTFAPLNIIDSQYTSPNPTGLLYALNVSNSIGDLGFIYFIFPTDQSNPLIGHDFIEIDQGEFTSHAGPVVFGLTGDITAIPEPATWSMMILGLAGIGFAGFHRTVR